MKKLTGLSVHMANMASTGTRIDGASIFCGAAFAGVVLMIVATLAYCWVQS